VLEHLASFDEGEIVGMVAPPPAPAAPAASGGCGEAARDGGAGGGDSVRRGDSEAPSERGARASARYSDWCASPTASLLRRSLVLDMCTFLSLMISISRVTAPSGSSVSKKARYARLLEPP